MFGNRSDGRKIKTIDPIFRLMPHIMKRRSDAHVYYTTDIPLNKIDEFIKQKEEQDGIKLSYMHIVYASLIRVLAERPRLNRFIMNGRIYARNNIDISLAIKKEMSIDADETTIKIPFTGEETIFEIKEKLEKEIAINKEKSTENATDHLAKLLSKIPNLILKITINLLRYLDRIGYLPKAVIHASPFHASAFLTNVGSLGIDSIYHHIYDFGTIGIFVAMGKKKKSYIFEEDKIIEGKTLSIAIVGDERICDGFYYANAMKAFNKYIKRPDLLEAKGIPVKDID